MLPTQSDKEPKFDYSTRDKKRVRTSVLVIRRSEVRQYLARAEPQQKEHTHWGAFTFQVPHVHFKLAIFRAEKQNETQSYNSFVIFL